MKALGFYLNQPSALRRRSESAALMRLDLVAYGARHRLDDRRGWEHHLADELHAIADELEAITGRCLEVAV